MPKSKHQIPGRVLEHEMAHYNDGLANIQLAIANGIALEQRRFSSNASCEFAISGWRQKSERRFYYSRFLVHFWAGLWEKRCD